MITPSLHMLLYLVSAITAAAIIMNAPPAWLYRTILAAVILWFTIPVQA